MGLIRFEANLSVRSLVCFVHKLARSSTTMIRICIREFRFTIRSAGEIELIESNLAKANFDLIKFWPSNLLLLAKNEYFVS